MLISMTISSKQEPIRLFYSTLNEISFVWVALMKIPQALIRRTLHLYMPYEYGE